MVLFPAGAAGLPAASLPKYRELLRKLRSNAAAGPEEPSSVLTAAKQRVLLRLREGRERAQLNPRRAFHRLRHRVLEARLSLRELREEHRGLLLQYYKRALGDASTASGSSRAPAGPRAAAALPAADAAAVEGLDARAVQQAVGSDGLLRAVVLAGIGSVCKLFLAGGARVSVHGMEHMRAALERPRGQALVTVSNHVGAIDDPLVTSAVLPLEYLLRPGSLRWTLCASDRCFKKAALVPFFRAGKVLPVERGAGIAQFGMQVAKMRLEAGEWVHIFPEGTRSTSGRMLPVRRGVGWLVAGAAQASAQPPIVLPYVHAGMEDVLPKGSSLPKLGRELRILVGEPVAVGDLLQMADMQRWAPERLHAAIAERVGQALYALKAQLEGLSIEEVAPPPRIAAPPLADDVLLPLIEEALQNMKPRWRDRLSARLGLPPLTERVRHAAAGLAASLGGASTEEGQAGSSTVGSTPAYASSDGAAAALGSDSDAQGWLLVRHKLRLLRGGLQELAAELKAVAVVGATSGSPAAGPTLLRTSSSAAALEALPMPMDAAAVSLPASAGEDKDAGGQLRTAAALAAEYSAERMRLMRQLLQAPSPPDPAVS